MNSRARFALMVLCICAVGAFLATSAHAQTNLQDASGSFTGLLDLIHTNANNWAGKLKNYATRLFWILASIQLVWTFFPLVIRNADFGEIVGELIRFVLIIGFFFALLLYSVDWATAIVDSFRQAGGKASGLGQGLRPGDIFGLAIEMAQTIGDVTTINPLTAMTIALAGAIVLLCFAFIAAFMGVTLVESYIVINASVLFMGFGGGQWTREYALAMARYAVAVGAKLFVLTLIVGLIMQSAKQWQAAYNHDDASMWTMVGLSLVCAYLAKQIPDLVQSLITGTSTGGGAALGSMAMAAAAVATAGAAAAVGAIGAGAAGAGAGGSAAGGAAGASGSGGLAGLINSSLSGGANMAHSTVSASNSNGTVNPASTLAPRMGGSPAASAARTASAANAGQTNGLDQQSAQEGPRASSDASGESGETAASQSASTSGPPSSGTGEPGQAQSTGNGGSTARPAPVGGLGGHQVAAGAIRTLGALSAMSVPGMEGAAGLSLGPSRSSSSGAPADSREPGAEFQQSPENTIAPVTPPPNEGKRS